MNKILYNDYSLMNGNIQKSGVPHQISGHGKSGVPHQISGYGKS